MTASDYWQMFIETGAPELYVMYANAMKTEERNVPEDKGVGASCHGLQ